MYETLLRKVVQPAIVTLCMLLPGMFYFSNPVIGQSNFTYKFIDEKLDSNRILKTIIPDGKPFYFTKQSAQRYISSSESSPEYPFAYWQKKSRVPEYTIENLFPDGDSILIDSIRLSYLIKKYEEFAIASRVFGEPLYYRPDYSINELNEALSLQAEELTILSELWANPVEKLELTLDKLKSRDRKGNLVLNKRLDTLLPGLSAIIHDLSESKAIAKSKTNNQYFDYSIADLIARISDFQRKNSVNNITVANQSVIDSAGLVLEYAKYYGRLLDHEKSTVQYKLKNMKAELKSLNDPLYTLLGLLAVDANVNYDTAFLVNRYRELYEWTKGTGADSMIILKNIKIDDAGKIVIEFSSNYLKTGYRKDNKINHDSLRLARFLRQYVVDSLPEDRKFNAFTSKVFFTAESLFQLPPERLSLTLYRGWKESEHIEYKDGKVISTIPPCISCYGHTATSVHEDECFRSTVIIGSELKGKDLRAENVIYNALRRYFHSKSYNENKWKRLKVDGGQVIVLLNNVRRLVLENENYWENVRYQFRLEPAESNFKLCLSLSGEFATGISLGSIGEVPSYRSYRSMEPKFAIPLQNYCSDVLYKIKDFLTQ